MVLVREIEMTRLSFSKACAARALPSPLEAPVIINNFKFLPLLVKHALSSLKAHFIIFL